MTTEQIHAISYCTRLLNNMLQLLVVALLASGVVAEDAEPAKGAETAVPLEAQAAESAATETKDAQSAEQWMRMPLMPVDQEQLDHEPYRDDHLYLKAKLDGHRPKGPVIARTLHSSLGHGPNIAAQDEIIKFTYSPAYYEPMWVLDYRFLKSGGRRYTRGPGGQILILPRNYKHSKGDGTHDYDSMIEHLRLKLIAEQNQRMREHGFAHHHDLGHHREQDRYREHEPAQHYSYEGPRETEYMDRERERMRTDREREPMQMGRKRGYPMNMARENMNMERENMNMEREHRMYH